MWYINLHWHMRVTLLTQYYTDQGVHVDIKEAASKFRQTGIDPDFESHSIKCLMQKQAYSKCVPESELKVGSGSADFSLVDNSVLN